MNFRNNLGFGCVALTSHPFEVNALKLLEVSFDEGIRHYDTAPLYGQGFSEKILGKFLKNKRNEVTITSKFGLPPNTTKDIPTWIALPLNSIAKNIRPKKVYERTDQQIAKLPFREIKLNDVKNSFRISLNNLRTDHIDYYFLHEALPGFLAPGVMEYLLQLKENGFVKKIGIATSTLNISDLSKDDLNKWDVLQYEKDFVSPLADMKDDFPDHQHFYHSILKNFKKYEVKSNNIQEKIDALLALAIKTNPGGKVLFSTINTSHLSKNLAGIEKLINSPEDTLKSLIGNAIYRP